MRQVTVQFLKNPDILHWGFQAMLLGADQWGTWIAVPAGTRRWKGSEQMRPTMSDAVFCAPEEGWWHLHYSGGNSDYSHFVDIVTPPRWVAGDRYEMIDLDLDVARHHDGTIEVQDEDEFAIHRVEFAYSHEMIRRAEEETRSIVTALETRREPFFDVAAAWLARLHPLQ
jgi:protein associated with RNAse G/E